MQTIKRIRQPEPGDIFWANLVNGCENRHSTGKERPVVVVDATSEGHLLVVGLTSKGTTHCGLPRIEVGHGARWNRRGHSYIFGERLTRLSRHDVFEFIGRLNDEDIDTVSQTFGLGRGWVA